MHNRLTRIEAILKSIEADGMSLTKKTIPFDGGLLMILYIQQLTDRPSLSELVIKPLFLYFDHKAIGTGMIKAREVVERIIYADDCNLEKDENQIRDFILSGYTVILLSCDEEYIVANLKNVAHRTVSEPQIEYTLRGPRDCFVENMDTNLSLVRYRAKASNLQIRKYKIGVRTKTDVAVLYIKDICNENVVKLIDERIRAINVDGVTDSGELATFLLNNKWSPFPQMGLVERSDMAHHLLLEGKMIVLMDGSCIALSAPKIFDEFFHSCDDRYDHFYFGAFMRLIRYLSLFIVLSASSYFVALTSFHMDALPSQYALQVSELRANVPVPPLISALAMEFIVELLREALLRVPKQIGPAVGIVSAIVIGQAAVSAGLFSPLLIILVSAGLLASFAMPDFALINPFRILKFIALIFTGIMGFYGLILFLCVLLLFLVSTDSFGVPYLAPHAPFNLYDFIRSISYNISFSPYRRKYLRDRDETRTKV